MGKYPCGHIQWDPVHIKIVRFLFCFFLAVYPSPFMATEVVSVSKLSISLVHLTQHGLPNLLQISSEISKKNSTAWWFGTWLDYDFPFSWEFYHPNWRSHIFRRGWSHHPASNFRHFHPQCSGLRDQWILMQQIQMIRCWPRSRMMGMAGRKVKRTWAEQGVLSYMFLGKGFMMINACNNFNSELGQIGNYLSLPGKASSRAAMSRHVKQMHESISALVFRRLSCNSLHALLSRAPISCFSVLNFSMPSSSIIYKELSNGSLHPLKQSLTYRLSMIEIPHGGSTAFVSAGFSRWGGPMEFPSVPKLVGDRVHAPNGW